VHDRRVPNSGSDLPVEQAFTVPQGGPSEASPPSRIVTDILVTVGTARRAPLPPYGLMAVKHHYDAQLAASEEHVARAAGRIWWICSNPAPRSFALTLIGLKTILNAPGCICCPGIWEEIAMKAASLFVAGLAVAILSIAPANAQKRNDGCNENTWRPLTGEPCPTIKPSSYVECTVTYRKLGWKGSEREWCEAAEQPKRPAQPVAR
jgi:hypothetical protein